jgi:hypothetical protein
MNTIKPSLQNRSFRMICLAFIICIGLAVRIGHGQHKQIYHVDEGFSYLVSGLGLPEFHHILTTPEPVPFKGSDFLQLYNLRPEDGGKHHLIREIADTDVHPPLYYHALHEVMRWSGGEQNKWQGIGLNLFLYILSAIILYALGKRLAPAQPAVALLGVTLWSLSTGSIQLSLFARMYEMQVLFGLMSMYLWICLIQAPSQSKTWVVLSAGLGISFWLGYMSHYYTLIFATLLTAGGVVLVWKDIKKVMAFLSTWGISLLALFIAYPTAWQHLFHSQRGQEIQALLPKFQQIINKIPHFIIIDIQLFMYTEVLLVIVGLLIGYLLKNRIDWRNWGQHPGFILGGIMATYMLITAALSPFFSIRYHALILPVFALGTAAVLCTTKQRSLRYTLAGLTVIFFMIHAIIYNNNPHMVNPLHNPDFKLSSNSQLLLLRHLNEYPVLWGALSGLKADHDYLFVRQAHLFEGSDGKAPSASKIFQPEALKQLQEASHKSSLYVLDMQR